MLIGNLLKVFNCVARSVPYNHRSIIQLSGTSRSARVIQEINLNECVERLGCDVEFYKLTHVNKNSIGDFDSKNIGVIPQPYFWGKYSVPVLQKKAVKAIERNVPFAGLLKRKWDNRPRTKVEAMLGNIISGFTPYIDLATITFFPYPIQSGYFVFFRPIMVFSGAGSAPTIKMLTDRIESFDSDSNGHFYVLVRISKEQAMETSLSELAVKFKEATDKS